MTVFHLRVRSASAVPGADRFPWKDSSDVPKNSFASCLFFAPGQGVSIVVWRRGPGTARGESMRGVAFMTDRATALIGRDRELEILDRFLEQAAAEGRAFLLVGEPGAGKTALLDAAADAAEETGIRVLRAGGAEFEADLTYSGLNQVLLPVFGQFERLGAAHRDALNVALGYGDGPPPARLLVSTATLTVLRQAAAARPVLMIVDDLPWLDRASAGVLGFVARRLAGSRVGFLAASRPGQESFFERAGLVQHELGPLDEEAASGLVSSRYRREYPALP